MALPPLELFSLKKRPPCWDVAYAKRYEETYEVLRRKRHSVSDVLPTAFEVTIVRLVSGILILSNIFTRDRKFDPIGTKTIFRHPVTLLSRLC
jgi:hypothetical protein